MARTFRTRPWWIAFLLAVVVARPASAASLFGDILVYGGTIQSNVSAGFVGPGPLFFSDLATDSDSATVATIFGDVITATTAAAAVPAAGVGNASGDLETRFEFGAPFGVLAQDTLSFSADVTASATSAVNSIGENSDAVAGVMGAFDFTASSPLVEFTLPDILVGTMSFPAMPAVGEFQFAHGSVLRNGLEIAALDPGDAALDVDILTGYNYRFVFTFGMQVPFGTDPQAQYEYSVTLVNLVPEPATWVLMLPALAAALACASIARFRQKK